MMDLKEGTIAVRTARDVITDETMFKFGTYEMPPSFDEPSGVFVTINTFPSLHLRGCIGFPGPAYPLREALVHAARSACRDPRFSELEAAELNGIVVEVTILTPPEVIRVKEKSELLDAIKIGRDGLMLEYKGRTAVFLPQVPVETGWSVKEYLEYLCEKAGLGRNKWKEPDCMILSFSGRIFKETSPRGDIIEVEECW